MAAEVAEIRVHGEQREIKAGVAVGEVCAIVWEGPSRISSREASGMGG